MKTFTNATTVAMYAYSGLNDRLQETVNGVTTTFTMDLNTGLTQALSDGTSSYIYGVGRIAQVNTTTEYFLGDALGSVRQLTDASGEITYARAYDPYGVVTSTTGPYRSTYGFTGEVYGDSTQLAYLRSRFYASGDGRFLTRDTWSGDTNSPLTLNKWNYALSNPTNYIDPTGECSYLPADNIRYIEEKAGIYLNKSSWLDTYTAAGIAVQCWAEKIPNDDGFYDGYGPAQITNMQKSTPWGDAIEDPNGGDPRGYGLLCYIVDRIIPRYRTVISCTICENEEYMNSTFGLGNYRLENPGNQNEMRWAVEYMRREIKLVLDVCVRERNCLETDKFIAAALSQNGPGFNIVNMKYVPKLKKNLQTPDYKLNWSLFFREDKSFLKKNTRIQLTRFNQAIEGLIARNWAVPARDTNYIRKLISGNYE